MVKSPLVVTKITLDDYVLRDADVRSSALIAMPDDGIECKVLRGKTLVLEWGICDIIHGMHTSRTKIELPLSACEDASLAGGELSVRMKQPPQVHSGSQPFDRGKRQRGKTTWQEYSGGTLCDGKIFELFCACRQSSSIKVNLKNSDAKIRKELESLLEPTAAGKAKAKSSTGSTPLTGGKRPIGDMEMSKMSAAHINKMLRQMQQGPPSSSKGASSASLDREFGSGGTHCDGCRTDAEEADDGLTVCERCQYAACGDCQVHHSRGTCFCKDANFGDAYPKKREWYMSGRW